MKSSEYKLQSKRLENLLKLLTDKGKLDKKHQQELDELSDAIASYEEEHFAFEPSNLIEMIELRMYQRKLKQKDAYY